MCWGAQDKGTASHTAIPECGSFCAHCGRSSGVISQADVEFAVRSNMQLCAFFVFSADVVWVALAMCARKDTGLWSRGNLRIPPK